MLTTITFLYKTEQLPFYMFRRGLTDLGIFNMAPEYIEAALKVAQNTETTFFYNSLN